MVNSSNGNISDGWDESAAAWLTQIGEDGDYGRKYVLDAPMLARVTGRGFKAALDVGCGEGRFCRAMQGAGIATIGIDPTRALIARARQLDPNGDYRLQRAESLDVPTGAFDLVVSYLSLIDIADLPGAMARMIAALRPGGTLLIANLTSFNTASIPDGWTKEPDGTRRFYIDNYLEERAAWVSWRGIRIQNWHRPLATYMTLLLDTGMQLLHFSEPAPTGGDPQKRDQYRRVPYFLIMEWEKPAG